MLIKRIALENVRSFLERTELHIDGSITILIGPNGGGKTNLLDAAVTMLRRYIFAAMYAVHVPTATEPKRHEFRHNNVLDSMVLERHSRDPGGQQVVEVEIEVTVPDISNMKAMKRDAARLIELAKDKYVNLALAAASNWTMENVAAGNKYTFTLKNGAFIASSQPGANEFLNYLQLYEVDGRLREEFELSPPCVANGLPTGKPLGRPNRHHSRTS